MSELAFTARVPLLCAIHGLPFAYLQGKLLVIKSRHHGEVCVNIIENPDPTRTTQLLEAREREIKESKQLMREVCAEFGDNDWPDDLYLLDVLEKHLAKHLYAKLRPQEDAPDGETNQRSVPCGD